MIVSSQEKQQTLKAPFTLKGKGLHTGIQSEVIVRPAPAGSGILFRRSDIAGSEWKRATVDNLQDSAQFGRQTSLGDIGTVEHLMAVFCGLGVDNAMVEVSGPELPGLDGSSLEYAQAVAKAGLESQEAVREYFEVTKPIYLDFPDASMVVLPAKEFKVSYTLSYDHDSLEDQFFETVVNAEIFSREIAPARTFILREEAEALMAKGYGKGAGFHNTLVFLDNKPLNNELRFKNEPARHKMLDLIGDLFMAGYRLRGHVIASRTGHTHNLKLATEFKKSLSQAGGDSEHLVLKDLNINHIKRILPHRYPFLFVDKVTIIEERKRAIGIKNVSMNDYFFQGHFPGHPVMPGVLIVEALAQTAGVVLLRQSENFGKLAYFMSIDDVKFRQPVLPGDQLKLDVEILKSKSKIAECMGRAYVGDKLVTEALLRFAIVSQEK